jgi:hypothetical protein
MSRPKTGQHGQQVATLWGRETKEDELQPVRTYHSYRMAVLEGQRRFGKGNFMVETDFAPTREDQLML